MGDAGVDCHTPNGNGSIVLALRIARRCSLDLTLAEFYRNDVTGNPLTERKDRFICVYTHIVLSACLSLVLSLFGR